MSCVIEDVTELSPQNFDKVLGELLVGHEGHVGPFLASIFDFLKRKTNFFKEPDAKRRVLDAYKQVAGETGGFRAGFFGASRPAAANVVCEPERPISQASGSLVAAPASAPPAATQEASQAPAAAPAEAAPQFASTSADTAQGTSDAGAAATTEPAAAEPQASSSPDAEAADEQQHPSKGLKPNAGRGADLGHYSWTQTLQEVTVTVPVGRDVKGKQLNVQIGAKQLCVGVKGQPPIIDGVLSEAIKPDDAMWNLADGVVELTLTKVQGMHWWKSVMEGDPDIDVQAVEPENSQLGDLDPETRQTVEKMMFDQRQKAMGLPTSEEMQKQEMMKKFMAAHPEMDFSNAKIM